MMAAPRPQAQSARSGSRVLPVAGVSGVRGREVQRLPRGVGRRVGDAPALSRKGRDAGADSGVRPVAGEPRRSRRCVEVAAADQADQRRAPHRRRPHQAGIARRADRREVGDVARVGVRCDAGCGDESARRRAKARPRRSSWCAASRTRSTTTPCAICSAITASRRSGSRRRTTSTGSRIS